MVKPMVKSVALIVAAGRGHRAGGGLPKQYRQLGDRSVLAHTVQRFLDHKAIASVRIVIHGDDEALYRDAVAAFKDDSRLLSPVHGGAERQDSVRLGLESLIALSPDLILIHDGARPFLSAHQISALIAAFDDENVAGVLPGVAIVDTVKRADDDGRIKETVDRQGLWRAQTPQCFRYDAILKAHTAVSGQALTDDIAVAEAQGLNVRIIEGDPDNIKLTTQADFDQTERHLMETNSTSQSREPLPSFVSKTGMGFDVHGFEPGDFVTLCGIEIPHDKRLAGHSDADVGLHALTDAILGALGAGDIGDHFPPTDEKWRGAPSNIFAEHAAKLVHEAQGQLVHVDLTLICERPKIKPHREAMRASVAKILELPLSSVSVKATTTEKLGFTGRQEGIAAQAIATIELPR